MTYSLRLTGKNLKASSSSLQTVYGIEKLKQDMTAFLTEHYGVDRFHPSYGSALSDYVGQPNTLDTAFSIEIEVSRVLQLFMQYQKALFENKPEVFSLDELLDSVNTIRTIRSYDELTIVIEFTTVSGKTDTVETGVL